MITKTMLASINQAQRVKDASEQKAESVEHSKRQNDSRPLKRGRLLTPNSEDEDDDAVVMSARHSRKKPRTEASESDIMAFLAETISPTPAFLARACMPEAYAATNSMDSSPAESTLDNFAAMSIESFEDFHASGARKTRAQRLDAERQNFTIYEDPDAESLDGFDLSMPMPMPSWMPVYADENKENEPVEYDMVVDDESAGIEHDGYYHDIDQEQQQYREALSEIPNWTHDKQ